MNLKNLGTPVQRCIIDVMLGFLLPVEVLQLGNGYTVSGRELLASIVGIFTALVSFRERDHNILTLFTSACLDIWK